MGDWEVRAEGFKELAEKLYSLQSGDTADRIQRRALLAAGRVMKTALTAATPVRQDKVYGKSLPAGALKAAIRLSINLPKDGSAPYARVHFGKLSYIAHAVDIGHVNANAVKGGRLHTPAHPFIRVTGDAIKAEVADAYLTRLRLEVNKVLKNGR